jgi:diguanylate cyclase (GGDEF)-like protein/PAS domain S-box-containing protein
MAPVLLMISLNNMNSGNKTKIRLTKELAEPLQNVAQIKTSEGSRKVLQPGDDKYRLLVESTDDSIYLVDNKYRYLFMNKKHLSRLGLPSEQVLGLPYSRFHSSDETRCFIAKVSEVFRTGKSVQHVHRSLRDGRYFLRTLSPITDQYGKIAAVTVISKDISELKMTEEKLLSLSNTDELTGLFNRRGFFALASRQLKIANRMKKGMSLLSADLDDLKKINDTFGHQEGDRALVETADILRESFRDVDIVARIGGDEFVILLIEPVYDTLDVYITRLQKKLELHNARCELSYTLSLSLGMASHDHGSSNSIDDLIAAADKVMYEQKRNKKKFQIRLSNLVSSGNTPAGT